MTSTLGRMDAVFCVLRSVSKDIVGDVEKRTRNRVVCKRSRDLPQKVLSSVLMCHMEHHHKSRRHHNCFKHLWLAETLRNAIFVASHPNIARSTFRVPEHKIIVMVPESTFNPSSLISSSSSSYIFNHIGASYLLVVID